MARRRSRKPRDDSEDEAWLSTYADCVTLLLCFFVILLSVSEPKIDKFEAITEAMTSGFVTDIIELPFKSLYDDFQLIIEDNAVELDVAAEYTDQGVRLDIGSTALFTSGSATLKQGAMPILREMVLAIKEMNLEDYRVEIEGHTDDVPIMGARFASNWELSAVRAAGVTRVMIAEGIEKERMQMAAFADVKPKVDNLDAQGLPISDNRALNRRIAVHIMRGDGE
ncbi:MAG: OmpA family protein [Rickettsiales bacterium]|nr:OmpA family protein [Rickettsiales bacterium]